MSNVYGVSDAYNDSDIAGKIFIISMFVMIIVVVLFGIFAIIYGTFYSQASPRINEYKVCQSGWGGTCFYSNKIVERNGCAITEEGRKICGSYIIRENN